ncbi:MAG: HAMP domain-containing sensor histidine kinase [Deltaproteobacteria bacterium]|nr:HAMP domain-containing sensor histidine kinase [Deltaproteobacteria bacterium]
MTPPALHGLLASRREAIVHAYVLAVRREDLAPRGASSEQVIDHIREFLDGIVRSLREVPEATPHDDAVARDPAARQHGSQRWLMGLPLDAMVREYGVLRDVLVLAIKEAGYQPTIDEWNVLTMCLTVGIAEAVTEYVQRREKEAVEAREEAIATVSHDLKNPLAVVTGAALLLLKSGATDDAVDRARVAGLAGTIARAAGQMERLVTDLLDLARFEAGHPDLTPTPERPADLLRAAREAALPLAEARGVALVTKVSSEGTLHCDRERVLQVLANLLGNAVKFSPLGSTVTLGAESRGGAVEFSVRDQGPGIPGSQLPHLFDRYWRSPEGPGSGTGLGLAIARKLVEAHGGTIRVESIPGAGSVFTFALPRGASAER